MPFPVHADRPSLANEIMRAYGLVNLSLEAMKDTVSVRIGNLSQNVDELTANLGAVIDKLLLHAPGGEKNIRACHVHLSQTETTLPIYVDFGSWRLAWFLSLLLMVSSLVVMGFRISQRGEPAGVEEASLSNRQGRVLHPARRVVCEGERRRHCGRDR